MPRKGQGRLAKEKAKPQQTKAEKKTTKKK